MSNKKKNNVGRPPEYKTPKKMQKVIEKYFEKCKGEMVKDAEGNIALDKSGHPIFLKAKPPTVTGLALALGFTSRQALLNYEAKDEFVDTIKMAKSLIEEYAEQRLYDRDGVNGAKFNLINNFEGWSDKQQIDGNLNNNSSIKIELEGELSEWAD